MNPMQRKVLRLTAMGLAVAGLFGCGGGQGGSDSGAAAAQASSVQMTQTATALRVSALASSDASTAEMVMAQTQYRFAASINAGANAGKALVGNLMLKAETDDGITQVEGVLVLGDPASVGSTSSTQAQIDALKAELKTRLAALREVYNADIATLSETLRAALAAGAATDGSKKLTAAQREALLRFKAAFNARTTQYQADVAAVTLEIRTQLAVLGGASSGDWAAQGSYEVKGTLATNGSVDLYIKISDRRVLHATGQSAADGSFAGSFVGPAVGDQGTWSASLASDRSFPGRASRSSWFDSIADHIRRRRRCRERHRQGCRCLARARRNARLLHYR